MQKQKVKTNGLHFSKPEYKYTLDGLLKLICVAGAFELTFHNYDN